MIQESLEDFRKRYKGTYVFLQVRGENMLVRYESDNEEDFCFYSDAYGDILVDEETARENISFIFPDAGLYNIRGVAHYFQRNPQRQWKRAPCEDNVTLFPILQELALVIASPGIGIKTLNEVFYPKYAGSIEKASNTPLGMAINSKFAVSASNTDDPNQRLLWYHSSPIGIIYLDSHKIEVKYHAFYQETLDFIRKEAPNWTATRN